MEGKSLLSHHEQKNCIVGNLIMTNALNTIFSEIINELSLYSNGNTRTKFHALNGTTLLKIKWFILIKPTMQCSKYYDH